VTRLSLVTPGRAVPSDRIVLTLPAAGRFRPVASLVLGGIGTRLDLPYERLDDLQLAVLCLLAAGAGREVTLEAEADTSGVSVTVGPLVAGSGADRALMRILERLVDSVEPVTRAGEEWIALGLAHPRPVD
jgi:hypothetical protein